MSKMNESKLPLSVGVLVLNYNTWQLALRALNAAIRLEPQAIKEYVLFDDGSSDPPPAGIDDRIRLIQGGVNRGYTGALKVAFGGMKSDLVVLFDADAYPLAPFAACVRERFEGDEQLGQLAFFAEDEDGAPTESFLNNEPTEWTLLLGQRLYTRIAHRSPRPSDLCVFSCCMATRLASYLQVQGFDENFDFLDADLDYSMRLRRGGWKVEADRSLRAFHTGGAWSQLQRHRVLRFYKSRWYLLRKHHLISNAKVARAFILARLHLERVILKLFGTLLFRNRDLLSEKILGRRELIAFCREHYR
jgi:GT2 family glycosyltransferase